MISIIITIIACAGTIANALKKRWGFILWVISNSYFALHNAYNDDWAQTAFFTFNLIFCLIGLLKWKKGGGEDGFVGPET